MQYITQHLSRGGWILALGLAAAGCASPAASSSPTHMQELNNAVLSSYATSHPDRLYYVGSEGGYDYYYLQNEKHRYKVARDESAHEPQMALTDDHAKWQVVSPAGPVEGGAGD